MDTKNGSSISKQYHKLALAIGSDAKLWLGSLHLRTENYGFTQCFPAVTKEEGGHIKTHPKGATNLMSA
jgi:hypothetical protein